MIGHPVRIPPTHKPKGTLVHASPCTPLLHIRRTIEELCGWITVQLFEEGEKHALKIFEARPGQSIIPDETLFFRNSALA